MADRNILRDEIINIIIAGRDTVSFQHPVLDYAANLLLQTASTLTFAMFLLSLHPEVFDRLRAEVLNVVGPIEQPTYKNIREMKYLRAVLNGWSPILRTMDQL